MKILILSDAWTPQLNGVVRTYEQLMVHLQAQGHEVGIIGPRDFKRRACFPGYKEIEVAILPYRALVKQIEEFAPDTIHIATEGPIGWAGRKYCLKHNIKYTSCYHSQLPDYAAKRIARYLPFLQKPSYRYCVRLIRKFHNSSAGVLVTTKSIGKQLKKWGVSAPLLSFTRGIDNTVFRLGEPCLFENLPRPVALYVGRLAIEKNIEEFLNMAWEGSKVIVGSGPQEESLRKKYPSAYFVGKKIGQDLAAHYQSADVFVFPSRTDTFGIVLIEALACGLPIAGHYVSGPRDVVTHVDLGALDIDLSKAANEAQKQGTKEQRYQHVMDHYTWDLATAQFLAAQARTFEA